MTVDYSNDSYFFLGIQMRTCSNDSDGESKKKNGNTEYKKSVFKEQGLRACVMC